MLTESFIKVFNSGGTGVDGDGYGDNEDGEDGDDGDGAILGTKQSQNTKDRKDPIAIWSQSVEYFKIVTAKMFLESILSLYFF